METDQQPSTTPKPAPQNPPHFQSLTPFPATPALNSAAKHQHLTTDNQGVIYGTNIYLNQTLDEIRYFLLNFEVTFQRDDEYITEKIYLTKLRDLDSEESSVYVRNDFDIDATHILRFSQNLYLQLIYFPVEIITCFDKILQEVYDKEFIEPETDAHTIDTRNRKKSQLRVQIIKLEKKDRVCIKDLVPKQLGRLVSLTGIVVKVSEVYPEMKTAHFTCMRCRQQKSINLENARIQQPKQCPRCKKVNTFELIHNLCQFTNKQYIKFQELLQNVNQGQTPPSVTLLAYDSNVDAIRPGDCVEVTGIYRCNMIPINRGKHIYKQVFGTYFDVISFEVLEDKTKRIQAKDRVFTEEERKQFLKMANQNQIIDKLASSFAPSIYGHKQVKKGLLAQLFGGSRMPKTSKGQHRAQVNVLLLGDPSTAKSQMLQQVHRIAPRSVYTCGRGSTSVGLTANVRKDPETRQFVLESGALVLSDEGVCCIDEFDKMKENIHTVLLEVMEQQTISIAKAGIVCQLNSRTAVLAAANPINSKYNTKKSVIQNINMPPALLSRFDLIYIMLDIPNQEEDRRIAEHILNIYTVNPDKKQKAGIYELQLLSNYISFARKIQPILSEEAGERVKKQYLRLRAQGQSFNTISATPRLLESMIRLSQAFAKMRLSTEVSEQDAEEAINLINFATLKSATDPETGIVDMDMIATGKTTHMKKKIEQLSHKVKNFLLVNQSKYSKATSFAELHKDFQTLHQLSEYSVDQIGQALRLLDGDNLVVVFKNYKGRPMFKLRLFNES